MRFNGFIGAAYILRSVNVDAQRCVNLYPEINEAGTQKDQGVAALIGSPGLILQNTIGTGPFRGLYQTKTGITYAVSGNTLYTLAPGTFAPTAIGSLLTSVGPVDMVDNSQFLFLVDGNNGYFTSLGSNTLTRNNADPNWKGSNRVACADGIFIFSVPGSNQFYTSFQLGSTLGPSTTINPLGFATNQSLDTIVGFVWDKRNLYLIGTNTTEIWFNTGSGVAGTTGNPFQIVQGGYMQVGGLAPFAILQAANTVFWLGRDQNGYGIIFRNNGYAPERISTHAIELAIQSYGDLSGTTAWAYQEEGHNFIAFNFANATTTWVFDNTTSMWHERQFLQNGVFSRHRAQVHCFAGNLNLVGDYQNANLYSLDSMTFTDNGNALVSIRTSPHLSDDMKRMFHYKFQLDFEPGIGAPTGQGQNPQVMMQYSDDGGHIFSNELWTTLGAEGIYQARAIWRKLGWARNRIYRTMISDPVKRVIIGATLDVQGATS